MQREREKKKKKRNLLVFIKFNPWDTKVPTVKETPNYGDVFDVRKDRNVLSRTLGLDNCLFTHKEHLYAANQPSSLVLD